MESTFLIYGCYGYTGKLITELSVQKGLKPVLSGRDEAKVKSLAEEHGLEYIAFDLSDSTKMDTALSRVKVVLHCAGPYKFTSKPMAEGCIRNKVHYLDITGEYEVFQALANLDQVAKNADVMLMPGTGFDVVPSDCLAARLKGRLPNATHLMLAFASKGKTSRGTAKTAIEGLGDGSVVRKEGKLVSVPFGYKVEQIDFDGEKFWTSIIPWGDVVTAYHSTGIPNIEVFMGMPEGQAKAAKRLNNLKWLFRMNWVKKFLKAQIDKRPAGPNQELREKGRVKLWGKVSDDQGNVAEAHMVVPEGYSLTAATAVKITENVLADNYKTGFQTPSSAYGHEFITTFDGVTVKDV